MRFDLNELTKLNYAFNHLFDLSSQHLQKKNFEFLFPYEYI